MVAKIENGSRNAGLIKADNTTAVAKKYEGTDPKTFSEFLGKAIAGSGMFGEVKPMQGIILGLECYARGIPPLMLAETYHLIGNKLSMRAEKMLANFNEAGGRHKIISRTGELASIELTFDGQANVFSLSWEEAKGEPFIYDIKEGTAAEILSSGDAKRIATLKVKKKYATPRARMQMLWARVISDGVNAVMPSAKQGCYTPEEVADYIEGQGGSVSNANGSVAGASVSQGEVIDGEFTVLPNGNDEPGGEAADSGEAGEDQPLADSAGHDEGSKEGQAALQAAANPAPPSDEYATASQSSRLSDLYVQLGLTPEQIEKALKKRGAATNRGLKFDVANELIATLQDGLLRKLAKDEAEAGEVAGESRQSPGNESMNPGGPARPEQVKECQALLVELNQIKAGSVNQFKAHLKASGLNAVSDLSAGDAEVLLADLRKKTLATFFDRSLEGWKPKGEAAKQTPPFDTSEEPAPKN